MRDKVMRASPATLKPAQVSGASTGGLTEIGLMQSLPSYSRWLVAVVVNMNSSHFAATTRQREYRFKNIYSLCGADRQHVAPTAPSKAELQTLADKLMDAFAASWDGREATASTVNELAGELEDRSPPLPNIGQVKATLKHLNPRKATGADGVPAWVLKRFHEELAPAIHDIVSASIVQCTYPKSYKHALISPVPKVANPTDINTDYRQISVLPQMAKVLEKIQLKLNRKDLQIKNSQHAFTKGRSTVTALTSVTQDWYNATDKGNTYEGVHAVFVDFSRAFDLVDHAILLTKLAGMGVNKSFWKWCQSFLSDRTQQVKLPGALSNVRSVIAGVPQGGVISPTLFNVHINDIEDCIPGEMAVHTLKYADDCSQYELVPHGSNSRMQEAMNQLEGWAVQNKMVLNTKKTKDMWISFKTSTTAPPPTCIGSSVLERVAEFKLLGVHMRNDLKWNTHVHTIIKQASKRIYHLRASRKANLPKEVGLTTYCTKIRSLLEYAAPIWGGLPDYLKDEIENVQNRCLDIINLPRNTVEPLAKRRDTLTRKEFKRILDEETHPCRRFIPKATDHKYNLRRRTNCHNDRFKIPMSHTDRHQKSFIPRAAKLMSNV